MMTRKAIRSYKQVKGEKKTKTQTLKLE